MNKIRKNITIDAELHRKALLYAETVHYTDFSGLVTQLLVAETRGWSTATPKDEKPKKT